MRLVRFLEELPTPSVLVDLEILERNIEGMAAAARDAGVRLRPHVKTHKTPEIARRQLAAGALGLTVAKTSEAEVFAAHGFDDLFIAYPVVGTDKARRLLELSERVRLSVGVDSVEGAATLAETFRQAGRTLPVRLKIDVGLRRVGVAADRAVDLARRICGLAGLELQGVFTHAGHAYAAESPDQVAETGRHEGRLLVAVANRFRVAGLPCADVSVGSTPTARHALSVPGVTECRPGNYVFYDVSQVSLGSCALAECALTVLATVVSVPAPDRAVVDAGSKTLSSDPLRPRPGGYGWLVGRRSRLERLSEEHGVVGLVEGETLRVGERVRILPNHACPVANLHDRIHLVRGERVEGELVVAARGCVQ
jgi:D-serine deaminase-like pyridoxal phosphate-dependent protein